MNKAFTLMPLGKNLVSVMMIAQLVLSCYLLALDTFSSLLFIIFLGLPLTLLSGYLLTNKSTHHHLKMALIMLAAGGFGMMLGCSADFGRTGLPGLLSLCQSSPLTFFSGPAQVWQKIQLTPWTYIGMFVAANLAMLSIKELRLSAAAGWAKLLYLYTVCNIGMLVGMLLGETLAIQLAGDLNQLVAAGLMISLMLLGMTLGMIIMLILTQDNHQRTAAVL